VLVRDHMNWTSTMEKGGFGKSGHGTGVKLAIVDVFYGWPLISDLMTEHTESP